VVRIVWCDIEVKRDYVTYNFTLFSIVEIERDFENCIDIIHI
jgi:hypothetical protein